MVIRGRVRSRVSAMSATDRPLISITRHARQQASRRHVDFWKERGVDGIYAEVAQALKEGRKAKTVPRWAVIASKRSKGKLGTTRYVWNPELTRCYVLIAGRLLRNRGASWVVVTVLRGASCP